jgi:adenosine kinase
MISKVSSDQAHTTANSRLIPRANKGNRDVLICGSVAVDSIMVFADRFANHILPDKIHLLNLSFLVPQMRREFGGCAGNIAYNLMLLGDLGYPMATVGHDFGAYAQWMTEVGVPQDYIRVVDGEHTAQAFITTDIDNNQITAFHPGAMSYAHLNKVSEAKNIAIGIVAPDGRDGMIQHAAQFAAARIPFIFDPGQGLPMFSADDLECFLSQATWVTVNEYEWEMMRQKTGWRVRDVLAHCEALIVTLGAAGSVIHSRHGEFQIPSAAPNAIVDPTGCGDAYRAGLIHGLLHGHDWKSSGRIASLMGAIKIETLGTQNHSFQRADFDARLQASFETHWAPSPQSNNLEQAVHDVQP